MKIPLNIYPEGNHSFSTFAQLKPPQMGRRPCFSAELGLAKISQGSSDLVILRRSSNGHAGQEPIN